MVSVFLSYDRDDAYRARHFAHALEKAGHEVWWDLHVRGGAQFSKVIEEALKAADAVVVLWSRNSTESAWVRDEAAAGRDRGRLVPVTIDGTEPPLGFRQFQTIDLSKWKGRGRPVELGALLSTVESFTGAGQAPAGASTPTLAGPAARAGMSRIALIGGVAIALALAIGFYLLLGRTGGPTTVSVIAADSSPASQSLARDLLVKLGALQGSRTEALRILDEQGAAKRADLRVSVSGSIENGQSQANVVLVSNKEGSMLWSKDFDRPSTAPAELEQQIAISTARVLGCAIEESSGKSGRLKADDRRTYLNACALAAEVGWDKRAVVPMLREVLKHSPGFRPAWALLLMCEVDLVTFLASTDDDVAALRVQLRKDIEAARGIDANMAEATLAEIDAVPNISIRRRAELADKAKEQDPENANVLAARSETMLRTGRMEEALQDAERTAQLDPLSPAASAALVYALLYNGQIDNARETLARALRLWPEAPAIRDVGSALDLRAGDFEKVLAGSGYANTPAVVLYSKARKDPSDANVSAFLKAMQKQGMATDDVVFTVQALGEMRRVDDFFDLARGPRISASLIANSYVLFRPWLGAMRRDPRFIGLAEQLGLVDYWQHSGKWPDFCSDPDLPYDCKAEAVKLR